MSLIRDTNSLWCVEQHPVNGLKRIRCNCSRRNLPCIYRARGNLPRVIRKGFGQSTCPARNLYQSINATFKRSHLLLICFST